MKTTLHHLPLLVVRTYVWTFHKYVCGFPHVLGFLGRVWWVISCLSFFVFFQSGNRLYWHEYKSGLKSVLSRKRELVYFSAGSWKRHCPALVHAGDHLFALGDSGQHLLLLALGLHLQGNTWGCSGECYKRGSCGAHRSDRSSHWQQGKRSNRWENAL